MLSINEADEDSRTRHCHQQIRRKHSQWAEPGSDPLREVDPRKIVRHKNVDRSGFNPGQARLFVNVKRRDEDQPVDPLGKVRGASISNPCASRSSFKPDGESCPKTFHSKS